MDDKRAALYRHGKELFSNKGYKDTNVADITARAGVSVGTFYNYFPSKDKLFMEIYQEENVALMHGIMEQIDTNDDPARLILRLLELNARGIQANPILRQWYLPDVSGKLEKLFREEDGLKKVDFLYRDFLILVRRWQTEGKMRADIDSELIMAVFEAIIRIGYHKEEIGVQYFPALQNYLTEFVLKGLTDCGR